MNALLLMLVLAADPIPEVKDEVRAEENPKEDEKKPPPDWFHGVHLTGEWGGARTWLEDHGVTIDVVYAAEVFADASYPAAGDNKTITGHLDFAVTLDTDGMGLWPGGKFYVLGQINHGVGINSLVESTSEVSNIEAIPYIQLGEFFFEQSLFDEKIVVRLGKQDANREFGTPRFGGNFINNNFGLIPSTPFPSYPTNGLGALVLVQPVEWLALRVMLIEGKPQIGSFGFDTAFQPDAGHFLIFGAAAKHTLGVNNRTTGTTSAAVFRQQGPIPDLTDDSDMPRMFDSNYGFYVQHDERIFIRPENPDDPDSFTVITRFGWSQPDRTAMPMFVGLSLAYHGLGSRDDDTVGLGFGYFTVAQQRNGTPGQGSEFFVEAFYKWRMTHFISLQPDIQYYHTPGGDGRDALIVGIRLKLKG